MFEISFDKTEIQPNPHVFMDVNLKFVCLFYSLMDWK